EAEQQLAVARLAAQGLHEHALRARVLMVGEERPAEGGAPRDREGEDAERDHPRERQLPALDLPPSRTSTAPTSPPRTVTRPSAPVRVRSPRAHAASPMSTL